jgi:hypothetical protein
MEKSENEVYIASNCYCKVGKITAKRSFEEDKSITETHFEKFDETLSGKML